MTDVAQHEATIVRSARREWCEAGDLGSSEQARQKVRALVKDHTREHQEVEHNSAQYTPVAIEPRNPHQVAHHIGTCDVQDGQFYSKEERCYQHSSAVYHTPVTFLRSSSAQILWSCASEVRKSIRYACICPNCSVWFNEEMKFGISTFVTDEGIAPRALARAIEERGFDSLFIAEHTHIPLSRKSPWPRGGELPRRYYRTLDPFIALTAAAAATERLLLGTGVALVIERDPIITAKEVASLDLVSRGRVIFGVGVGWNREEMQNHGTDPRTRGKLMDERIRAMIEMWTNDEPEFHGRYVDFDPIGIWPKPVQKPYPPIYVGGGSRAFERIARFGDAWLANGLPPGKLEPMLKELREVAGRDVPVSVFNASSDRKDLEAYAHLSVERVLLGLPTLPESETLKQLDDLAQVATDIR
jgi:probable F420-dependent oxidoreductase